MRMININELSTYAVENFHQNVEISSETIIFRFSTSQCNPSCIFPTGWGISFHSPWYIFKYESLAWISSHRKIKEQIWLFSHLIWESKLSCIIHNCAFSLTSFSLLHLLNPLFLLFLHHSGSFPLVSFTSQVLLSSLDAFSNSKTFGENVSTASATEIYRVQRVFILRWYNVGRGWIFSSPR